MNTINGRSVGSRINEWFNMKLKHVLEQCETNEVEEFSYGKMFFHDENLETNIVTLQKHDIYHYKQIFDAINKSDMVQYVERLIGIIQDCLHRDDPLKQINVKILIDKLVILYANRIIRYKYNNILIIHFFFTDFFVNLKCSIFPFKRCIISNTRRKFALRRQWYSYRSKKV